jgi:hypothetical protein
MKMSCFRLKVKVLSAMKAKEPAMAKEPAPPAWACNISARTAGMLFINAVAIGYTLIRYASAAGDRRARPESEVKHLESYLSSMLIVLISPVSLMSGHALLLRVKSKRGAMGAALFGGLFEMYTAVLIIVMLAVLGAEVLVVLESPAEEERRSEVRGKPGSRLVRRGCGKPGSSRGRGHADQRQTQTR